MNGTARQLDADEVRDRAEWRALVEKRGLEPMTAREDPGFAGRVMDAIRAGKARRAARIVFARRAAAAAAASLAALLAIFRLVTDRGASAPSPADWIASRQLQDGAWSESGAGETFRPAVTALAAMALAAGDVSRHADAVAAAVAALEAMQNADGSFGVPGPHGLYNHAFATFALIDDARRNGKGLTPALEKAIVFSLSSQNAFAAWGYPGEDAGNDALTVWELGILAAARELGWNDDAGALRRGLAALGRRSGSKTPDYRFALDREPSPRSGGLVLTRIATQALVPFIDSIKGQGTLAGTLLASLDVAEARANAGDATAAIVASGDPRRGGICAAAVSLLDRNRRNEEVR